MQSPRAHLSTSMHKLPRRVVSRPLEHILNTTGRSVYSGLAVTQQRLSSTEPTFAKLNITLPDSARDEFIRSFRTPEIRHQQIVQLASSGMDQVWDFYSQVKHHKLNLSTRSYIKLMELIAAHPSQQSSKMAITAFYDALNSYKRSSRLVVPLSEADKAQLAVKLLSSFEQASDHNQLLLVNMLWETYMSQLPDHSKTIEVLYHRCQLNILLGSQQLESAIEYFHHTLQIFTLSKLQLLSNLPIDRYINELCLVNDCNNLDMVLAVIIDEGAGHILTPSIWLKILDAGLEQNHYQLVKTIYDHYIMKGFDSAAVTTEQAIFEDFSSKNKIFKTLNDKIIFQILHTLSINGDVNSTLTLIETHFLHKSAKGEKALTKELCIKIIESYCYHEEASAYPSDITVKTVKDQSIKKVLDVLNGFMVKFDSDKDDTLSYKDITSAMSLKFWKYYAYDQNIQNELTKRAVISETIVQSEENQWETMVLPRKISNKNIHTSNFGNMLANMKILREFVRDHIEHLSSNKYQSTTRTLFINCLLNHVNLHQNFTATTQVLLQLHNINPDFWNQWLDSDSLEIVLNTLAVSSAGKISSRLIMNSTRNRKISISSHAYYCLLSANLRGYIHDGLHVILYDYLKDFNGIIAPGVKQLLKDIPLKDIQGHEGTVKLLALCEKAPSEIIARLDKIYDTGNLYKNFLVKEPNGNWARKYYQNYDVRDSGYIKGILP